MSIQLVTYANQTVTPTNDAIIYEKAVDQNGIFYGCNVTVTSNNVNITGGYGIVCGREFVINSESIAVTLAPSGTLEGRLYVRLDLADADAPIQLLTATGNTLPPLVQDDDVNYTNGVWEMELATFTVGVSSLSDVVETFESIVGRATAIENGIASFFGIEDVADKITLTSAWTEQWKAAFRFGNVVFFSFEAYAGNVQVGAHYTIANISSDLKPKRTLPFTGHTTTASFVPNGIVNAWVWADKTITVRLSNANGNYVFVDGWFEVDV